MVRNLRRGGRLDVMASSWGTSWGDAWGNSWGGVEVIPPVIPPPASIPFIVGSGGRITRPSKRRNGIAVFRELRMVLRGDPCKATVRASSGAKALQLLPAFGVCSASVSMCVRTAEKRFQLFNGDCTAQGLVVVEPRGVLMSENEMKELVSML